MPVQFGWSDTLHAMTACFFCNAQASSSTDSLNQYSHNTSSNPRNTTGDRIGPSPSSQSLPEALRPLLMNDSTDDDEYADSLSLHSNIGGTGRKKNKSRTRPSRSALSETETDGEDANATQSRTKPKRRGKTKKKRDPRKEGWFTLFGYHLFGKNQPAIQLPPSDDEEEDEEEAERRRRRVLKLSGNGSGSAIDSDAAPLDDAAIAAAVGKAHITRDNKDPAAAGADDGTDDKEESQRKWKEREALERALSSGFSRISSLNSFNTDGEFEGFQGSGDGASLVALKSPPSERTSVSSKQGADGMDEDEVPDFDGSVYSRPTKANTGTLKSSGSRTTTSTATRSSNSTPAPSSRRSTRPSHHRAHSNVSSNEAADEFHEAMFNTSATVDQRETSSNDTGERKKKKSKKTWSKPSPLSSTATSSQSPSLPSPPGNVALGPGLSLTLAKSPPSHLNVTGVAKDAKDTKSKPDGLGHKEPIFIAHGSDSGNRGFPSVGFGRRSSTHLNGAFLAHRGD